LSDSIRSRKPGSGLVISYFNDELVVLMVRPLNTTASGITNEKHGKKYYITRPQYLLSIVIIEKYIGT